LKSRLYELPRNEVMIEAGKAVGPLETWRHSIGHGGINTHPLPARVVEATAAVKPRLIRIFLQEFFDTYPAPGRFDWSRLDPYMESFANTGAKVVAAITFKPPTLYPEIDEKVWLPNDVAGWQALIAALVRRYSVERPIVTYWEVGNEVDIGQHGGCPYLITDPDAYARYYRMTIEPILATFPEAKVGGPGNANVASEPLPGLIRDCRETGTQLDFISWHRYDSSMQGHVMGIELVQSWLEDWPGERPETLITEWNNGFPPVSVEDDAFDPRRAANMAATLLAMREAGVSWTFYYHLWDQVFYPDEFASFFDDAGLELMVEHWNRVPHRFGLFGVGGEVRPQYFVYKMLSELGEEELVTRTDHRDLRVLAGRDGAKAAAVIINFNADQSQDRIVTVRFAGLDAGVRELRVDRIDAERRWRAGSAEMIPVERREVAVRGDFRCQVYCPADSVSLVTLA
jgi:hypothetical protein